MTDETQCLCDIIISHFHFSACIYSKIVFHIVNCHSGHPGGVEVRDQVPKPDPWVHRENDFVCFMSTIPGESSKTLSDEMRSIGSSHLLILLILECVVEMVKATELCCPFVKNVS